MQTVWNLVLIFLAILYAPQAAPISSDGQLTVNLSGIVEFLGFFSDPSCYLDTSDFSKSELAVIRQTASSVTEGCVSDYDKIRNVLIYVSDNTYYDYRYVEGREYRSQRPCDVLTSSVAICQGYSDLVTIMLRSVGIPCMTATSKSHAFNFAHDGQRWIFFDPTWCSSNQCTVDGELIYRGYNIDYFDLTSQEIEELGASHMAACITCGEYTAYLDWETDMALISGITNPKVTALLPLRRLIKPLMVW